MDDPASTSSEGQSGTTGPLGIAQQVFELAGMPSMALGGGANSGVWEVRLTGLSHRRV